MLESTKRLADAAAACAGGADAAATARLLDAIAAARRVFLVGAGRTGLAARAFAIRLRQLGREAFVAGEASTPAPSPDDLVIVCTASSKTPTTLAVARRAIAAGAPVAVVTSAESPKVWADARLLVALPLGSRAAAGPLGTVFELALQLYFDAAVAALMERLRVDEAAMRTRHSTLE